MKKIKIAINRQTLRSLSADDTTKVAGGFTNWKCTSWNEASHCPTCGNGTACQSWNAECE